MRDRLALALYDAGHSPKFRHRVTWFALTAFGPSRAHWLVGRITVRDRVTAARLLARILRGRYRVQFDCLALALALLLAYGAGWLVWAMGTP